MNDLEKILDSDRDFASFFEETANVPCAGCRSCCKDEQIRVDPKDGDNVDEYLTDDAIHELTGETVKILKQKENGECIYLGDSGCTIYDRRPKICRFFDCRVHFMALTKAMRRDNPRDQKIVEGKKRLHTLEGRKRLHAIKIRDLRVKHGI